MTAALPSLRLIEVLLPASEAAAVSDMPRDAARELFDCVLGLRLEFDALRLSESAA